jgi:hypothetical protein
MIGIPPFGAHLRLQLEASQRTCEFTIDSGRQLPGERANRKFGLSPMFSIGACWAEVRRQRSCTERARSSDGFDDFDVAGLAQDFYLDRVAIAVNPEISGGVADA